MDGLALTLATFLLVGFIVLCVADFFNPISEPGRFIIFVVCLVFAVMMAVMAFTSFPVWYAAGAVMFAIGAVIFRLPRKRPKDRP